MQKLDFKVKVDGEENGYFVRLPSGKLRKEAREYKDKIFKREAFRVDENGKSTAIFNHQVYNLLKSHGIWTDEKDERLKEVSKLIEDKLRLVSKGKTDAVPTIDKLRDIVIKEIKPLRYEQFSLLSESRQFDNITVEFLANKAEIDYLTAYSTFTEYDDPVYSSIEDFYAKETEVYTDEAVNNINIIIGNSNKNWIMDLPENKLLKRHGLMNDEGQYLLNEQIVNADGKKINDKGFLVNDEGKPVNEDGDLIDDEGELLEVNDF